MLLMTVCYIVRYYGVSVVKVCRFKGSGKYPGNFNRKNMWFLAITVFLTQFYTAHICVGS